MYQGDAKVYDNTIKLTPKELMDYPWPFQVSDPFAIVAYVHDKESNKTMVRYYDTYPSESIAKARAHEAMKKGYKYFDLHVVDTRRFLPFPPDDNDIYETEQHDKLLEKLLGKHIDDSKKEMSEVLERKMKSSATTPVQNYMQRVQEEARKLMKDLKNEEFNYNQAFEKLEESFNIYKKRCEEASKREVKEEEKPVPKKLLPES